MSKYSETVERWILYLTVFMIPVVVLPVFSNPFDSAKLSILMIGVTLAILAHAGKTFIKGALEFSTSNFDFPVLLLAVAYLVSAILRTPNKMEAFFFPGTATFVLGGALLFFFLNSLSKSQKSVLAKVVFFSGVVVAIISLLAGAGFLAKMSGLPLYVRSISFNTLGGPLPLVVFLGVLLPIAISILTNAEDIIKKSFFGVCSIIIVFALLVNLLNILPGKPDSPKLPTFNTSWIVAIDSLKDNPLWGVGPANYLTAFNLSKPLSYNSTDLWAIRFTNAQSYFLTLLTEVGLVGFAAFAILTWSLLRSLNKDLFSEVSEGNIGNDKFYLLSLGILFVLLYVLPASLPILILFFILLSLNAVTKPIRLNFINQNIDPSSSTSKLPVLVVILPIIAGIIYLWFYSSKVLFAEMKFNKALAYLSKNDGKATYETLGQAISENPYVDNYHASYAQVNLALAQVIAQNKNLTDNDRQTITQLVDQAIREGKAAVTLNPQRSGNWEILARIYQSIIPFAQGADQYAIQTYSQAIALDPTNPVLRISLGGIYYSLNNFEDASRVFELATYAKPDYANAHYNLAAAYREKGDINKAITEMNTVLSLVQKDSSDYNLAKAELDNLEKKKPAATKQTQGTENLTPPKTAEKPVIKPPLELPKEATPPASP
jgi:tetratricopeptide (TPR) repeat protein